MGMFHGLESANGRRDRSSPIAGPEGAKPTTERQTRRFTPANRTTTRRNGLHADAVNLRPMALPGPNPLPGPFGVTLGASRLFCLPPANVNTATAPAAQRRTV